MYYRILLEKKGIPYFCKYLYSLHYALITLLANLIFIFHSPLDIMKLKGRTFVISRFSTYYTVSNFFFFNSKAMKIVAPPFTGRSLYSSQYSNAEG